MSSIQKFMFDNAIFDPPLEPLESAVSAEDQEPVEPETPPPPGVTLDELAQARAEAYAQGLADANQSHELQSQDAVAHALQHLASVADYLVKRDDHERQQLQQQVLEGTLTLTRRLFPHLAENGTLERLSAFARQTLDDHADEREILIAVPRGSVTALKNDLRAVLESRGMTERVKIVEDQSLAATDCRITWADGGANMVIDRIWQAIEKAAEQAAATHGLPSENGVTAAESAPALPEPGPAPAPFTPVEAAENIAEPDFSALPSWLAQAIADEPSHIVRELGPAATEPLDVAEEPSDSEADAAQELADAQMSVEPEIHGMAPEGLSEAQQEVPTEDIIPEAVPAPETEDEHKPGEPKPGEA